MFERRIGSTTAAAMVLWPTGFALILLDLITGTQTGELGLFSAGAGGVFNIRGFFCRLGERERNAFELGQDYAEVKSIR